MNFSFKIYFSELGNDPLLESGLFSTFFIMSKLFTYQRIPTLKHQVFPPAKLFASGSKGRLRDEQASQYNAKYSPKLNDFLIVQKRKATKSI